MRLKINKFDIEKQAKGARIWLILGRRGTGKSIALNTILYHLRNTLDIGCAFSPTESSLDMFKQHMPDCWLFNNFDIAKLEQLINIQRQLIARGKKRRVFIIADDCSYDKTFWRNTTVRYLFLNGRHLLLTFLMSSQYLMDITPDLRTNIDYVFALREPILSNKRKLWMYLFGIFESFHTFTSVMDRLTENHGIMVLDATATSSQIQDCVFWFKARIPEELPKFRLGADVFYKLAAKHASNRRSRPSQGTIGFQTAQQERERKRITHIERVDRKGRVVKEDREDVIVV